jgi:hypothetical protein
MVKGSRPNAAEMGHGAHLPAGRRPIWAAGNVLWSAVAFTAGAVWLTRANVYSAAMAAGCAAPEKLKLLSIG